MKAKLTFLAVIAGALLLAFVMADGSVWPGGY